jgi:hypothetical protein
MDDDQFVSAHSMIDKIGIASGRKHANARNIGLTPEARVSSKQTAR